MKSSEGAGLGTENTLLLARLHIVQGGQYCFARWRLSSSVVVCNTLRRCNVTHQGAARDGGPVVFRAVRATPCYYLFDFVVDLFSHL